MSEKKEYSVDEILEDVRRMTGSADNGAVEALFSDDGQGFAENIEAETEASVFDDIEKTEKDEMHEAAKPEADCEAQSAESDENEEKDDDVKVFGGEKNDEFSFEKMREDKAQERERESRTRVFKRKDTDSDKSEAVVASDVKGKVDEVEAALEKELKEKRQEKIDKFRLAAEKLGDDTYGEEEEEVINISKVVNLQKGEDIFKAIENTDKPKKENSKRREKKKKRDSRVYDKIDVGRVKLRLDEEARQIKIRKIVTGVCCILCMVLSIMKTAYVNGKMLFLSPLMEDKHILVYAMEFLLGAIPFIFAIKAFLNRIKESERPSLCSEALTAILFFFNMLHNAVLILTKPEIEDNVMLFGTAVCFIALLQLSGESKQNLMIRKNLAAIVRNERLMGVFALEKESEKLASGISKSKEPMILCAGEVEIPNSFMDSSMTKDKENLFFSITIPLVVVLSVVCGIIAFISYGTAMAFSSALVSALSVSLPVFIAPVLIWLIARTNETLNRTGCEILGYEDVENIDETDAIVLDTADIFVGNISHFHLISRRANIDTLHAFEIACSVLYSSGGVLKGDVAEFMKEKKLFLPEVEDIKYEEKLGISCWVEDKCVLLGTDKMMKEHNIYIPPEYSGEKYEREGSKVFYLAVDTYATAMFCADYLIGRQARKQLIDLYKTGVILMLMTTDPHIDETFVANTLGVSDSSIKTVSPVGAKQIRENISKTTRQKRTGLIFRKNVVGLLKVINAAFRLYDVQSLAILIQIVSMVFAIVVSGVLSAAATGYLPGVIFIIAYHMIWTALGYFVTHKNKK